MNIFRIEQNDVYTKFANFAAIIHNLDFMKKRFINPKYYATRDPEMRHLNTFDEFLENMAEVARDDFRKMLGYPATENRNMDGFYDWYVKAGMTHVFMNNAGDPFGDTSVKFSTMSIERKTIKFFATLLGINADNVWVLITASGTDGNNHGIYFGAQKLKNETGLLPIVYVSKESHYSNMRLCDLQNLEVRLIDCDEMGRMKPEALRAAIYPGRPALMIYSMGSTFKGAIDDQAALNDVIDDVNPIAVYRHVDAALFGGYLPFTEYHDMVDYNKCGYQSIAISGHKFIGVDAPCGMFITTRSILEAQKSYTVGYLNGNMPMINCSRSSIIPLKFYWIIDRIGIEGFSEQAQTILEDADFMLAEMHRIGWTEWKNDCSNTIFFKRPSEKLTYEYNLARGYDERLGGELAHVVVMQKVTRDMISMFISDLEKEID